MYRYLIYVIICMDLFAFSGFIILHHPNPPKTHRYLIQSKHSRTQDIDTLGYRNKLDERGIQFHSLIGKTGIQVWEIPESRLSVERELAVLQDAFPDLYIEQEHEYTLAQTPNDPDFIKQTHLHNTGQDACQTGIDIGAVNAWETTTGNSNQVIVVIDGGMDLDHEDLKDNLWVNPFEIPNNNEDDDGNGYIDDVHGWDFANNDNAPEDDTFRGHGTHVAGIAAARGNNGKGVTGVCWNCKIMPLKFTDSTGRGSTSTAMKAIEYAVDMKQKGVNIVVINNSWGGGSYSRLLKEAVEETNQNNILFVAAAGNDGTDNDERPFYPASYKNNNIIAVGAIDCLGKKASFSNYGRRHVDIFAPGEAIYSTIPGDTCSYMSGTSMAAPQVSGAIALIHERYPIDDPLTLKYKLLQSGISDQQLHAKCRRGARMDIGLAVGDMKPWEAAFDLEKTTLCPGDILTCTFDGSGADNYKWYVDEQFVFENGDYYFSSLNGYDPGMHKLELRVTKGTKTYTNFNYVKIRDWTTVEIKDTVGLARSVRFSIDNPDITKHTWMTADGFILGRGPHFSVNRAGDYMLVTRDLCGYFSRDTFNVKLEGNGNHVLLGDVNGEGAVNAIDIMLMSYKHGITGPGRNCNGQPCINSDQLQFSLDWPEEYRKGIATGTNIKHADANGDGEINAFFDGEIVRQYANSPHPGYYAKKEEASNAKITLEIAKKEVYIGERIGFRFYMHGPDDTLKKVHSIAASLDLNINLREDPDLDTESTWLGTPEVDVAQTYIYDRNAPRLDFTFNRTDETGNIDLSRRRNFGGGGTIAVIEDIDTTRILSSQIPLTFTLSNLAVLDNDGNIILANPISNQRTHTVMIRIPRDTGIVRFGNFSAVCGDSGRTVTWKAWTQNMEFYELHKSTDGINFELLDINELRFNDSTMTPFRGTWTDFDTDSAYYRLIVYGREGEAYQADLFVQCTPINDIPAIHTINDNDNLQNTFDNLNAKGRYVRMYGTQRATEWGYSLYEFEVYGTPSNNRIGKSNFSQHTDPQLSIFPNPTRSKVYIQFNNPEEAHTQIKIFDLQGRIILTHELNLSAGSIERRILIRDLKPGYYLLNIRNAHVNKSKSLIIVDD